MKHIHFLMSLAVWATFSTCIVPHSATAATAGFTGGRSAPTPSAECIPTWLEKEHYFGASFCWQRPVTCDIKCWVYCYDRDGISFAQRIPCGQVACEFSTCVYNPGKAFNVGTCSAPAMNPCAMVDVSSQAGCEGGRATLEQCKTQYLGFCATTSGAEVCCE